jgi:hypothetical protein
MNPEHRLASLLLFPGCNNLHQYLFLSKAAVLEEAVEEEDCISRLHTHKVSSTGYLFRMDQKFDKLVAGAEEVCMPLPGIADYRSIRSKNRMKHFQLCRLALEAEEDYKSR